MPLPALSHSYSTRREPGLLVAWHLFRFGSHHKEDAVFYDTGHPVDCRVFALEAAG